MRSSSRPAPMPHQRAIKAAGGRPVAALAALHPANQPPARP